MDDGKPIKKGRGYPPKEYQWPKGVSGWPWGRPPGSKNKKKRGTGLTPTEQATLEEAQRKVRSSDGEMSAIRAVMRAQQVSAAKGSPIAQRDAIERTLAVEQKLRDEQLALLEKCEEYKRAYEELKLTADPKLLAKYESLMLPHPDDVEVDWGTSTIHIHGPANTRERKLWNEGLEALAQMRAMVFEYRRKVGADPTNPHLNLMLLRCTDRFMRNNDRLPPRYRLKRIPIWKKGANLPMPALVSSRKGSSDRTARAG